MPIGRFLRHGHIFHPVRVLFCHSCAIICNSLVFRLLHSSILSYNVKKLYIPVNLLYSGDGAEFLSCARAGTEDSAGPPHCVGPLPFREPMPAPSSVPARAGLSNVIPGLACVLKRFFTHVEFNIRHAVSKSGHFTHDMTFFHHDVRRKRFNAHGELHCMEMIISKDHVAEKSRRGWGLWRHGRP